MLDAIGAPRETRPRWDDDEVEILRDALRARGGRSERATCFEVAPTLGRDPHTVHMQWKRLKRKGFALSHSRGTLTPYTGLSLGDDGARVWLSGARGRLGPMNLALEGTRRESAADDAEHRVGLTFGASW